LAAAVSGKVWLFTLGQKGGTTPGGTKVAEVGPVPVFAAPEYLLRINHAGGPPNSKTPVHSHPGSESFYVLAGQVSQTTPHGVNRTDAGQSMVGLGAGQVRVKNTSRCTWRRFAAPRALVLIQPRQQRVGPSREPIGHEADPFA
jgi:quercetin dioxygenase-like cupin family protein